MFTEKELILKELLFHNHNNPKSIDINIKHQNIKKIIEITSNNPEQGTIEWINERQIGGSDTAAVLGKGYKGRNFYNIVEDKIIGSNFNGNIATRFGRIMENVSKLIIKTIYNATIYDLKSLPNKYKYTSYNPDGIAFIEINEQMLMILLEFKSPFSRIPSGIIPKEYIPQIKAGMCAIPSVNGTLFVNTMIRVCNINDFDYNNKCSSFHKDYNNINENLTALGLIFLFNTECNTECNIECNTECNTVVDLGLLDEKQFDYELRNIDDKKYNTYYSIPLINNDIKPEQYFKQELNIAKSKGNIYGIIPYKVFKIDIIWIENNEPEFIDQLEQYAKKYGEIKYEADIIDNI